MPQRDVFHDNVKQALIKDGWAIAHDPLEVRLGQLRGYIDLAAERPIAAEKEDRKIAAEVKSFVGPSLMADLEDAIGQHVLYRILLAQKDPDRVLYLAVGEDVFERIFAGVAGEVVLEDAHIRLLVVRFETEEIVQWIETD